MISLFTKEKTNAPKKNGASTIVAAQYSAAQHQASRHPNDELALSYRSMVRPSMGERNKSVSLRPTVTIAMSIKFGEKCVDIAALYYKDLAKMANLLKENPSLIATLESCECSGVPGLSTDIARLRLRNVMNYLVEHFAISRSRFYVDKLLRPACSGEYFARPDERYGDVIITLKYPSVFN